jgi:hypothetical protein
VSRPKIKNGEKRTLLDYAHEQLAIWEALRKLGFLADDIYAAFYNGNELFTTLRIGDKEWNGSISRGRKISPEPYIAIYTAECERWNKTTEAERRQIFDAHMTVEKMVDIAIGVRLKGIDIPNIPNAPPAEDVSALKAFFENKLVVFEDRVQAQPN